MSDEASRFFSYGGAGLTSDREDWRTPPELFGALNEEFSFDVDAAANDANHLLPDYWTKERSAFEQDWRGRRVFCNPPYGRDSGRWIAKFASAVSGGGGRRSSSLFFPQGRTRRRFMSSSTRSPESSCASCEAGFASAIRTRESR